MEYILLHLRNLRRRNFSHTEPIHDRGPSYHKHRKLSGTNTIEIVLKVPILSIGCFVSQSFSGLGISITIAMSYFKIFISSISKNGAVPRPVRNDINDPKNSF